MFAKLRLTSFLMATSLLSVAFTGCAEEEDDSLASINGSDRGILGLKILFGAQSSGSESLAYEIAQRGEVILKGDALMQGQTKVGLKIPGMVVGSEYSISVVATGSRTSLVCRGLTEGWEILPGMVSTVEVNMACANE